MPIHFIANDPFAAQSAPQIRRQPKRPNRPAGRAGFTFLDAEPEKLYQPGTPGFVYWQCRESVLAALEAWEAFAGNLPAWQGKRKRLPVLQDAGVDLNAYYDRDTFSFFHQRVGTRTFFSGESVDVVAHEVGHGLLDAIRPELWDASFLEAGAFHESFGDCVAILTALDDRETRVKLLALSKTLKKRNFVESTIELLAAGTKALDPGHNAAAPRRAYNALHYQIPSTLPSNGGPGELIDEVHSFGMVFTGCFYDVIVGIFAAQATKTEKTLLTAARKAGRLLVRAAQTAVVTPRFFQSVGRAMILADDDINGGAHRQIIKDAFGRHAIALGANALLGATAVLAGAARTAKSRGLSSATKRDLAARLGVSAATRFSVGAVDLGGHALARVVHMRRVPLGSVHKQLAGVSIDAPVPVLLGASGGRAAVMGDMPAVASTEQEVRTFAASLLEHGQIAFAAKAAAASATAAARGARGGVSKAGHGARPTHRVAKVGNARMLVRVRFSCGCQR